MRNTRELGLIKSCKNDSALTTKLRVLLPHQYQIKTEHMVISSGSQLQGNRSRNVSIREMRRSAFALDEALKNNIFRLYLYVNMLTEYFSFNFAI